MHVCETRGAIIYTRVKLGQVLLTAGWSYFDWQGAPPTVGCSPGDKRSISNLLPVIKQAPFGRVFLPEGKEGFPLLLSLQSWYVDF